MNLSSLFLFISPIFLLGMQSNLYACETFQAGNQAYFNAQYEEAVISYEECLSDPSYSLHSNLASSYYKLGKMGKSYFHFLKAQQWNPKHQNLSFNLNLLQESLVDQEEPEFLEQVSRNGAFEYKVLFFLVVLCGIGSLMRLKLGSWLLFLSLGLLILWSIYHWDILVEQPKFGVVIESSQSIFSNQNLHSSVLTDVHAGKLLRIISEHGEWVQVMVQPGLQGWVPSNILGKL